MVHAGGRGKAETKTIFPYSNAVREVDSTRARQTESSRSSMPLRWQHGRESQQGVTLLSLSSRHRIRPALALAWRGADLTLTILRPADVRKHPDGWTRTRKDEIPCFVRAVKAGGGSWREVQCYQPCLPGAWCYLLMSPCWRTCVYM